MTPDNNPTTIPLWGFILGAAVVVVGAMAAIWFALPGPDTSHKLTSPSGTRTIELAELCADACNRVAILDATQADAGHVRTGCALPELGNEPLFATVVARWSADEQSVEIDYQSPDEAAGTLTLALTDCTLTQ